MCTSITQTRADGTGTDKGINAFWRKDFRILTVCYPVFHGVGHTALGRERITYIFILSCTLEFEGEAGDERELDVLGVNAP